MFVHIGAYNSQYAPWGPLRRRGVYNVYYQSEPLASFQPPPQMAGNVTEHWDYSHKNMAVVHAAASAAMGQGAPHQRFVPVGSLPSPQAVVADDGRSHMAHAVFLVKATSGSRGDCFKYLRKHLGRRVVRVSGVWSAKALGELLRTHWLFLNIHKRCNLEGGQPLEPRVGMLVNAGAMVMSERAHPEDEAVFAGMPAVIFCNVSAVPREYKRLSALPVGERRRRVAESQRLFAERWAPLRIMQRAGIVDLVAALGRQKAVGRSRTPGPGPRASFPRPTQRGESP